MSVWGSPEEPDATSGGDDQARRSEQGYGTPPGDAPGVRPLNGRRKGVPGSRSDRPPHQGRARLLLCGNPLGSSAAKPATKGTQNPVILPAHLPIRLYDRRERTLERIP